MTRVRTTGYLSLALLFAVLVATNVYVLGPLRQTIIDRELGQIRYFLGNHAKLLESLMRTTELTLENVVLRINREGIGGDQVHRALRQSVENWPMARVIGITDATGFVVHSSRSVVAPKVDLFDRDYVAHWLNAGSGRQFISGPIRNAVDGLWQISLSIPIRRDGRLTGVIAAVIDIGYLAPILRVSEATGDYATLIDREFRMIARYPERPEDIGRSMAEAALLRPLHDPEVDRTSGTFTNHFTGEERIAAALRFYDGNLILSSSRALTSALGYWRPLAVINALVSTLLLLAATLAVLSALRHLAARNREAQNLMILNRQLEERTREAERLAAAKSDFLAVMSHEIRTPLTAVMGMIDLAAQAPGPAAAGRHLGIARSASVTLLAVINDILDMSRLESGKMVLETIPFGLDQLVDQAIATIRSQADDKNLDLLVSVDPDTPRGLRGDPTRLTQTLLNLLGNAVKFTERGAVTLTVAPTGERPGGYRLRFEVADTGPGIPIEQQGELFKPFEQLSPSRARRFGGSGLGLSICKGLVEAMGGTIGVESEPGIGSRFWFEVDLLAGSLSPAAAPTSVGGAAARPLRVLVVDDNRVNRELICEMLASHGHRVSSAATGAECLDVASQNPVDVILLDIQMPDMDGVATIRELRRRGLVEGVAALAVTANAFRDQVEEYGAEGFAGHVAKPIEWPELLRMMQAVAGGDSPGEALPAQVGPSDTPPAGLDPGRLQELAELLGPERVRQMVAETLRVVRGSIAELDAEGHPGAVGPTLHTVRGVAGNFGLMAIAAAAREPGAGPAPDRPEAADRLRRAVERVEADLDRLWGIGWNETANDAGKPEVRRVTR